MFLLGFLKRFPQYAASDFYISGESYGAFGNVLPLITYALLL
jgi:carboxypeptidase C (cathepsin A)